MTLKPFEEMSYHPMSEQLVEILQTKTQNSNPLFFRTIVAYYFALVASQMRANIRGWSGRGTIPVNVYAIALSPSGTGKGHAVGIIEGEVINAFREIFYEHTFPVSAAAHCEKLSIKRAAKSGEDPADELIQLSKDFQSLGALMFQFDAASSPAIKQMRQKMLMANAGSVNLQVDEVGANFTQSIEALTAYLELYDKGLIKDKLIKSNADNTRFERLEGHTPANMMLFGTGSKLLDGAKIEDLFVEMLDMGYARRSFYSYTESAVQEKVLSADELYEQIFNEDDDDELEKMSDYFAKLADLSLMGKEVKIEPSVVKYLLQYKLNCESRAREMSELETIKRSELSHRYFKVLKLAGAYTFIDQEDVISVKQLEYAIKYAEDSGEAFSKLMTRDKPYVKLAKYLGTINKPVTLPELDEDLAFFKGTIPQKDYLINMATAYGYLNGIVIKKVFSDGIQFLKADAIQETDLDHMIIAYSTGTLGTGFNPHVVAFNKLPNLFKAPKHHWVNHHMVDGNRTEDSSIKGFNLLVLDVDGTVNLSTAMLLMKDYKAIYHTTKSHTDEENRFRIVLPMNYRLDMTAEDYKQFYRNVISDLPFQVDEACDQRSRKWETNAKAIIHETDGELFDVLPYIPQTTKNEEREKKLLDQAGMDNLERWVMQNTGDGNRNNMLLRYAMVLMDADLDHEDIKDKVIALNDKLKDKLSEIELAKSIFHTLAQRMVKAGKI